MMAYLTEFKAYTRLDDCPILMPKVYYAYGNLDSCFLLLEDLRDKGSLIDQVVGGTAADARAMIRDVGKLEGAYIGHPVLQEKWLSPGGTDQYVFVAEPLLAAYSAYERPFLEVLQETWLQSPLQKLAIDPDKYPKAAGVFNRCSADGTLFEKAMAHLHSRPIRTLVHGDARGDNCFRTDAGLVWIDWQLSCEDAGPAFLEPALPDPIRGAQSYIVPLHPPMSLSFCADGGTPAVELGQQNFMSFDPEVGALQETTMWEDYFSAMADAAGNRVPNLADIYTIEDSRLDYKIGAILYGLATMHVFRGIVQDNLDNHVEMPVRMLQFFDKTVHRLAEQLERNDCLAVIELLAAKRERAEIHASF